MQYMQKGGYQQNPLTSLTLGFTVLFLAGFVVTNFVIFYSKMGTSPAEVIEYYNGSEETFRPARTFGSMLEVTHGHLPVMAVVILMLTHLITFSHFQKHVRSFLSQLLSLLLFWMRVQAGWYDLLIRSLPG